MKRSSTPRDDTHDDVQSAKRAKQESDSNQDGKIDQDKIEQDKIEQDKTWFTFRGLDGASWLSGPYKLCIPDTLTIQFVKPAKDGKYEVNITVLANGEPWSKEGAERLITATIVLPGDTPDDDTHLTMLEGSMPAHFSGGCKDLRQSSKVEPVADDLATAFQGERHAQKFVDRILATIIRLANKQLTCGEIEFETSW